MKYINIATRLALICVSTAWTVFVVTPAVAFFIFAMIATHFSFHELLDQVTSYGPNTQVVQSHPLMFEKSYCADPAPANPHTNSMKEIVAETKPLGDLSSCQHVTVERLTQSQLNSGGADALSGLYAIFVVIGAAGVVATAWRRHRSDKNKHEPPAGDQSAFRA